MSFIVLFHTYCENPLTGRAVLALHGLTNVLALWVCSTPGFMLVEDLCFSFPSSKHWVFQNLVQVTSKLLLINPLPNGVHSCYASHVTWLFYHFLSTPVAVIVTGRFEFLPQFCLDTLLSPWLFCFRKQTISSFSESLLSTCV